MMLILTSPPDTCSIPVPGQLSNIQRAFVKIKRLCFVVMILASPSYAVSAVIAEGPCMVFREKLDLFCQ